MEIIIHLPTTVEGRTELAKSLSLFHAEHSAKMIQRLPCPVDQKLKMLDAVVNEARNKDT